MCLHFGHVTFLCLRHRRASRNVVNAISWMKSIGHFHWTFIIGAFWARMNASNFRVKRSKVQGHSGPTWWKMNLLALDCWCTWNKSVGSKLRSDVKIRDSVSPKRLEVSITFEVKVKGVSRSNIWVSYCGGRRHLHRRFVVEVSSCLFIFFVTFRLSWSRAVCVTWFCLRCVIGRRADWVMCNIDVLHAECVSSVSFNYAIVVHLETLFCTSDKF